MSGCCPPVPPSSALGGALADANGPESDIRPGESAECYMARGGNTTGLQDDATEDPKDKIANTSIPLTGMAVDVTFTLTQGGTRTATSWTVSPLPSGLTLDGAHLHGTFATAGSVTLLVTAKDSTGDIDSRSFTVAPTAASGSNEIRLISPLQGGIVNSKFGPRVHPITGVMKPHTGIDMKMEDRSTKDVTAAADGEVVLAGGNPSSGYGLRVWLKHVSADGAHMCTTTYNHLAKIYVTQGQKVMAGQKVGYEGNTGASTGNHLHFEVKLPDGKFVDPEPYINGTLKVATGTNSSGDATGTNTRSSNASLTKAQVEATQQSCTAFGPDYPAANPAESTSPYTAPPNTGTDPFEQAWYFIMQHEVGPHWMTTPAYSPGDSELDAGLHQTKEERKKTGYVSTPNFPGGETKFGIAQKPNPRTTVDTMTYDAAKQIGHNNYWNSSKVNCATHGKRVSVMLLDMNYLHGDGNSKHILQNAGISSSPSDHDEVDLANCQVLYAARVAFINSIPRPEFTKGWLIRASDCLAYVKTLTYPPA